MEEADVKEERRLVQDDVREAGIQLKTNAILRQRLEGVARSMRIYTTGPFDAVKADLAKTLNAAGFQVPEWAMKNATEYEKWLKDSTNAIFDQVKEQKGQFRNLEYIGAGKAQFGPLNQPNTNRAILAQQLGLLNGSDKFYRGLIAEDRANRDPTTKAPLMISHAGYDANFYADPENQPSKIINEQWKKIPAKGGLRPENPQIGQVEVDPRRPNNLIEYMGKKNGKDVWEDRPFDMPVSPGPSPALRPHH
jgi:hypothetical protein